MNLSQYKIWKRIKFLAALTLLLLLCSGLVVYENNFIATVNANSANIDFETYAVGTSYDGVIVNQYVNQGDAVTVGQKLFEIKSDSLHTMIAVGTMKPTILSDDLSENGNLILTARQNGIVSQVNAMTGSFVNGGKTLAVITGTSKATIRASFELSAREYEKINSSTMVIVKLNDQIVHAKITGISQTSSNGHTFTVVTAKLPNVTLPQSVFQTGSPVRTSLILNTHTYYARLRSEVHIKL